MKKSIDQLLEEVLRSEPDYQSRRDFSDQVIRRIRKLEAASLRKLYIWMVLGVLAILGFGIGVFAYFLPASWKQLISYQGFDQVVPAAVLIGIAIGVIQYLDKKLVKEKLLRMH